MEEENEEDLEEDEEDDSEEGTIQVSLLGEKQEPNGFMKFIYFSMVFFSIGLFILLGLGQLKIYSNKIIYSSLIGLGIITWLSFYGFGFNKKEKGDLGELENKLPKEI